MTEDALAQRIVEMMNQAADISDRAPIIKELASLWALHVTRDHKIDVPTSTAVFSLFKAIGELEVRVIALELALEKNGIEVPRAD